MSVAAVISVRDVWVGRHVVTADGEGVICAVERGRGDGWRLGEPEAVRVGFGFPVVEERARGRKVERVTFLFEVERRYELDEVQPKPASAQRESVAEFMARKHDPRWRPAALPRSRRLPRLSEEKFEALMREQGAARWDEPGRMGA